MKHSLRTLVGCAALATGVWVVTSTAFADTPDLPADSYKKAADADLKFLQTRLGELVKKEAEGGKPGDGQVKPAIGAALLLAAYADVLGDSALKTDAVKVIESLGAKKYTDAAEVGKKMAVKPGKGKTGPLAKPLKDDAMLLAIMAPYRGGKVGGQNIERDIRDMIKKDDPIKIEPAAVELIAVRTAVLNAYGFHHPNDKAKTNDANKKKWEKWSSESVDVSKKLVAEAAKGAKADEKQLKTLLSTLNARCTDCHNEFREE